MCAEDMLSVGSILIFGLHKLRYEPPIAIEKPRAGASATQTQRREKRAGNTLMWQPTHCNRARGKMIIQGHRPAMSLARVACKDDHVGSRGPTNQDLHTKKTVTLKKCLPIESYLGYISTGKPYNPGQESCAAWIQLVPALLKEREVRQYP